ncbi:Peroxisomal-coenzyme A synthetase [Mycena venus]|uniref:Peroxisomal-coenzyme A synthetase n=1 Tax=Mycena venus TaxID=2733690 RepID=A0A8H6Y9S2_9AGAR|nr:Peroxisomal-coenzyme A synthetase [Mycena venus]
MPSIFSPAYLTFPPSQGSTSRVCHHVEVYSARFPPWPAVNTHPEYSLGDLLADTVADSHVTSLLDCLPDTSGPALYSPDLSRQPLLHDTVRSFVQHFALPPLPVAPSTRSQ